MGFSVNDVHYDQILSNLSVGYQLPSLIAEQVFPVVKVKKESDTYLKWTSVEKKLLNDKRAPGAPARDWGDIEWETGTYQCVEHALKKAIPDRVIQNADAPIKPKLNAVKQMTYAIRLAYEKRVAQLAQDTTQIPNIAASVAWNAANPDIEADIDTAKEEFRKRNGFLPNAIIIPYQVARYVVKYLKSNSDLNIKERYTIWKLPDVIYDMKVISPQAVEDTAAFGKDASLSNVWGDMVTLCYINPNPGLDDLSFGWTIRSRDFRVRRWRDEEREAEVVEVSVVQDEVLVAPEYAEIITGVIS